MSQFHQDIQELHDDEQHWNYARGKAAQLKLAFKNKMAAMRREQQIQIQQERERNYQCSDSAIRYDALHAAAYHSKAGQL
ncbi:hypothetical protein FHG08_11570 [Pseudoalteromonas sp. Scap03]|uniref:hypothetical protein n=1 Tax=unclassified Pseudoalteromonas TaxID=194690 RepID=UPI0015B9B678|nr:MULTISPECIES: hypothetical protein [unclassified Pseudoalteromonas]NWL16330.1 hypothetical protein [Pseudoalteromonas sp. Scap03]QLE81448.1 hypothetical protein FLM54_07825 [Pseudoalteromonas sp. Scap25]QLE89392.1 hypothetical protein FLM47_07820 [Pseudoalteromonas sp. Scap06]